MNLTLVKENDPILQEPCEDWDFQVDGSPADLVKEMARLMFLHSGIGLAAPQCGVKKRIFIMGNQDELTACVNPKIVSVSDQRIMGEEGCLSFPGLWLKVKRPASVVVSYQNTLGETKEETLYGLRARIFLHEFDHLMGITFDQRVGNLSLKLATEKRKKRERKIKKPA